MKIDKKEFLEKLKILDSIIDKKSLGNKNCVYFNNENLISQNNGMLVLVPFETNIDCLIQSEKIIQYLNKSKQEEIELNYEDDNLILKDDKTELILKTNINKKEDLILEKIEEWKELPTNFYEGIKYSFYSSITENYQKYSYIGNFLFNESKIISTDNKRLSEYTFAKNIDKFCLDISIVSNLIKIPDIINYKVLGDKVVFKTKDEIIIYCSYKNIDFPEYKKLLDLPDNNVEIDFLDCLIEGFNFCDILNQDLENINKKVFFEIDKNKLLVFTETMQGKIKYNYKLNKEYENIIKFNLNPNLLKEIIKQKNFKCYYFDYKMYFINDKYRFVCMVKA